MEVKTKKILIIDDDSRNIFALKAVLKAKKFTCLSASSAQHGFDILASDKDVAVVLMDMMMPELDGYQTTSQIRTMPAYKQLPILAVTAKAMMGDREKCIAAGASDYISKPVDVDQLVSLLRVWLYDRVYLVIRLFGNLIKLILNSQIPKNYNHYILRKKIKKHIANPNNIIYFAIQSTLLWKII